ncbi:peptide methionine sulfoxide reductase-like isoform X3 [Varroa jacobsoni]|uniref:peptide methionine sulfoxide reductase-like isoform X3 n=1 Tax=Varroa jacobsoni TaxID=62625 RepID=UPI000BF9CD1A|nr:peptide methionine sulfoxide reductase-like isoform X3 [Varroa jacobsoni]
MLLRRLFEVGRNPATLNCVSFTGSTIKAINATALTCGICSMGLKLSSRSRVAAKMSSLREPKVTGAEIATIGMGCFWGVEALYGATPGVLRTRVGFTGGDVQNPNYHDLADHTEGTELEYDPAVITYEGILDFFWKKHDPTEKHKCQYKSIIWYHSDDQKAIAERTLKEAQKRFSKPIVTEIAPAKVFYNAERYHQKYRLQGHKELMTILKNAGMDDIITSHVAARLNGYLGGHGSLAQFQSEDLGLPDEAKAYVAKVLQKSVTVSCH